jgi:peptide/nickel transport system substrate-binding protein
MSLRTQRGLALMATLVLVAAACAAPAPPAETPTPDPLATPPVVTPEPPDVTPEPPDVTPEPPDVTPAPPDEAQHGGNLVIGEWQLPSTVNPYMSSAWVTQQAAMPVLMPTIMVDADGEWIPYLLEELPAAEEVGDGFTITMRVKPDLLWSDGETLDANDIEYTYNWAVEMAEAGIGCGGCGALALRLPDDSDYYVTDVEVSADGREIVFHWQEKYAGWIAWASITILPEQYFGDIPAEQIPGSMPVTDELANVPASGPFTFVGAGANRIDYARNETFAAFPDRPYLDSLTRVYFPENKDGMITAFLTGEIDQMSNLTQADYDAMVDVSPDIGRAELIPAWLYEHLGFNAERSEVGLDDVRVRNALHMAVDKEDLWNTLFPGHPYTEACAISPASTWWADPTITCPPYDPDAAAALLDEAGWTDTPRQDADGNVMRLRMCTTIGNPIRLLTLGKVAQYFSVIGVPTDIMTQEAATLFADYPDITDTTECGLSRGNYEVYLFTYLLSDPGGLFFSLFHSSNIPPGGDNGNWNRLSDPELDEILEGALTAIATEDILATLGEVERKVVELMPQVPLYYRAEVSGVSRHVGNFQLNPSLYGPVWNIHEWFVIE